MEEKDLYLPVKNLFESLDFTVKGEVKDVDVMAKRDHMVVTIELKKEFSLHLIAQGAKRQRLTDYSYVAIPKPTAKVLKGTVYKDKIYILRRLGVGLIHVTFNKKSSSAKIVLDPNLIDIKQSQRNSKRKRTALLNEFRERKHDYNVGGTRGKTVTAYRLVNLRILVALRDGQPHTTKEIVEATHNKKATSIMYKNFYGWFDRVGRGTYTITPLGIEALKQYKDVIKTL